MANRYRTKVVEEGLVEPEVKPTEAEVADAVGETTPHEQEPRRKESRLAKVLGGDLLGDKLVLRQIPLLLLCLFYLLLIVNNRYRIESLSREKMACEERINYLREQRIQMQKRYQQSVKISQIAEDLSGMGVGITAGPPYELKIED